tara:strand:+ start:22215 stop:23012 length:798 start_codon:yes stop_codon:yes gene_type:complete
MKVAIITSLFTEWDMNIYSCHLYFYLIQILDKSTYDFDTIFVSVLLIIFIFTYYKTNYPFFFKKYFYLRQILNTSYTEDFLYRSSLISFSNLIPIIIYSLVLSFSYVYVFEIAVSRTLFDQLQFSILLDWTIVFILHLIFIFLRIFIIKLFFLFTRETQSFKIIFLLNFIRITIYFSISNVVISYFVYQFFSYEAAFSLFVILKTIIIIIRPFILFFGTNKFNNLSTQNFVLFIFVADFLISLLFFNPFFFFEYLEILISYIIPS